MTFERKTIYIYLRYMYVMPWRMPILLDSIR